MLPTAFSNLLRWQAEGRSRPHPEGDCDGRDVKEEPVGAVENPSYLLGGIHQRRDRIANVLEISLGVLSLAPILECGG